MNDKELKTYFLEWRKNRQEKFAKEVIAEFKSKHERLDAVHQMACAKDIYPFQEYASWLVGHITNEFYFSSNHQRIADIIDAYLISDNHTVKRNLMKVISLVTSEHRKGELITRAFNVLMNTEESIALRSYSFKFILSQLKQHPELRNELNIVIFEFPELFTSPAMKSCLSRLT